MKDELRFQVALNMLPGIGCILAKQLVSYCGSVPDVFSMPRSKLERIPGIGPKTAALIKQSDLLDRADLEIDQCEKANVRILFYTDEAYPYKLKQTLDCPLVIYVKGQGTVNCKRAVAIVGTREATDYGKAMTRQVVEELKAYDTAIISGLAYGIDISAHRAAVSVGIPTHAVLGSSVDVVYPHLHRELANQLQEQGTLISEYPLGTKPEAFHFPARNRIIAGMSDAVLVVEAAEKGGALITADLAHSYSREVFALPGNLDHPYSRGCNRLIQQQKAIIFTSVEDLASELNWDLPEEEQTAGKDQSLASYSPEEQLVIGLLTEDKSGLEMDRLAWKSQLNINQLASVLLTLEFNGVVKALPGKKYRLKNLL